MKFGPLTLGRNGNSSTPVVNFKEVLSKYDFVDVQDGVMFVRERGTQLAAKGQPKEGMRELGSAFPGFSSWAREEYNNDLRGFSGLQKYDQMRRSDGTTRGTLRLIKTPVQAARWYVAPAGDGPKDKMIADFVWKCLTQYMTQSWPQTLTEILSHLDFGFYCFEKVFDVKMIRGNRRVVWRKWAPRHPMDVQEFIYDKHGGPNGLRMWGFNNQEVVIPIKKLLVFTNDKEAGNMEGISILRSAYKHWYYKEQLYKIDAIQKERHGIGVPVIKLPPNFDESDRKVAEELGRNLRTNERAHIVAPPGWEIIFADIEGLPVDIMRSITHHNLEIARNVLGQFIAAAEQQVGTSEAEEFEMFQKSTRFIAEQVRDVINKWAIPELVDFNWAGITDYPELRVKRIGDVTDQRVLSFAIRNYIGAGVLTVDDELEKWVRDELEAPPPDPSTKREVATPQAGPGARVGPPRQGPPSARPAPGGDNQRTQDRSGTSG